MRALFILAEQIGVTIEWADLTHLGRDGDYNHTTRTIRLQIGMLERLERSVLAHELAHAVFGDVRTFFDQYDERDERRADEWAAHLLIDIAEYRIAEARFGTNIEYIAQELNIMDYLVEAFERTLCRLGSNIYVNPRLGLGQWDRKIEAVA